MENVFSFKSHLGRRIRVTFLGGMKLGQHIDMVSNFDVLEIYGSYTDFFQRYSIFDINVLASSSLLVRTGPAVQFRAPAPFFSAGILRFPAVLLLRVCPGRSKWPLDAN